MIKCRCGKPADVILPAYPEFDIPEQGVCKHCNPKVQEEIYQAFTPAQKKKATWHKKKK
jgi:hypothetical protein